MSDETRNPQDETTDEERRPSHLTDEEPDVEGHIRLRNEEPGGDDGWVGGQGEHGVRL